MKKRKLDRIIYFDMNMNPYDLYVAVPLHIHKKQIIKKVTEYLRKLNFKDNQRFGYYRIRRGKVQKYRLCGYELFGHEWIRGYKEISNVEYAARILPIEFVEKGEKIERHEVIKYKRMGHKKFELMRERKIKKLVGELIDQFLEEKEENGDFEI